MTTPIIPSIIDEQVAGIELSFQIVREGLPREALVSSLSPELAEALKAGKIHVRAEVAA